MPQKLNLKVLFFVSLSIIFLECNATKNQELPARTVISVSGSAASAPYSSGILVGNTLYCSGSIGVNPDTNALGNDIKEQTRLALEVIKSVVLKAEFGMKDIVKVTVFLKNIDDYSGMNEMYRTYFPEAPPARETVGVADIVRGALIEISCIAVKSE